MLAALQNRLSPVATRRSVSQDTVFEVSRELDEVRRQVRKALGRDAPLEAKRALRRGSEALNRVVLGPARSVDAEQARRDVAREPCIYLNGVRFAGPEDIFLQTLGKLTRSLGGGEKAFDALLSRLARTSAGADSYFVVQWLMGLDGSQETATHVVMPRATLRDSRPFSEIDDYGADPSASASSPEEGLRGLELAVRRDATSGGLAARIACRNGYAVLNMDLDGGLQHPPDQERLALVTTVVEDLLFDKRGALLHDLRYLAVGLQSGRPPPCDPVPRRSSPVSDHDGLDHPPLCRADLLLSPKPSLDVDPPVDHFVPVSRQALR